MSRYSSKAGRPLHDVVAFRIVSGGEQESNTRNRLVVVGVAWLIATVLGWWAVTAYDWHPFGASREARITDEAFDLLMLMAVPIATFVLVVIGYSLLRDRDRGQDVDGPPIRTNRTFVVGWLAVTTILSIVVIITPGFSGLDELRAYPEPDLVIDVKGERWSWEYTYAESGVQTRGTLMVPIDTRIMFRISSTDVIHSFWIPAFRIKMDAVPGIITTTMVTAEKLGTFESADELRVQCAELCGVGHARMWTGVSVVTEAEFDAWLEASAG